MASIGYGRVSTAEQSLDRQHDELTGAGCDLVFSDVASGKRGAHRPEWDACLRHLRAGDTLVVVELSRLGRNSGELGTLADTLEERTIALRILNLGIDTGTPAGRMIYTIIGAVAAMERDLLIERTQSGLAAARARGRLGGRTRTFTERQQRTAQRMYDSREYSMTDIAHAVGSTPTTIYRYLDTDGRPAGRKPVGSHNGRQPASH